MSLFLGIDTSNYRTSAALIDAETGSWQNEGRLLDVPEGTIGLRQSEALFQHTLHLSEMIRQLPLGSGRNIAGIGVSNRPRSIDGSYMPCFLAGENLARSTAHLLDVPLLLCSHQQGHIAAAAFSAGALELLHRSFLAWHLSGGTTELLLVCPGEDGLPHATRIGGTNDLAAGQLVDRTGQLLGMNFPAGIEMEKAYHKSSGLSEPFRVQVKDSTFSLSGVENKVKALKESGISLEEIAYFAIETIGHAVVKATKQAREQYPLPVLCTGGVMSNSRLQSLMQYHFEAMVATPQLSGDNAVGVSVLAAMRNKI